MIGSFAEKDQVQNVNDLTCIHTPVWEVHTTLTLGFRPSFEAVSSVKIVFGAINRDTCENFQSKEKAKRTSGENKIFLFAVMSD